MHEKLAFLFFWLPLPDPPGEYDGVYEKYSSEKDEFDDAHEDVSDELKALLQDAVSAVDCPVESEVGETIN